jgi:hypothetical protein
MENSKNMRYYIRVTSKPKRKRMNVPQANPAVAEVRALKETAKGNIREAHAFPKAISALALVAVVDPAMRDFILEGLSTINVGAIVLTAGEIPEFRNVSRSEKFHPSELFAFDFFVFDGEDENLDVVKCMKAGVVPVMPEKNVFA